MRFSIIVPIYGVEKYLRQCVESALNQTYCDFELILVDDGSKDNCPQICDEFASQDSRIQVIHKENGGTARSRQAGVAIANGEYVTFVDGDDWIAADYLEQFNKIIENYFPDTICCGHYIANEKKNNPILLNLKYGLYKRKEIEKYIFPFLIQDANGKYFTPSVWGKAFKREIYQQQQLEVNVLTNMGEDAACTKPCLYYTNTLYIMPECLYYYRYNTSSITKSKKALSWNDPKTVHQHIAKQINLDKFDFEEQIYRSIVHLLFNVATSQFYRNESYKIIKEDIIKNIRDPFYAKAIKRCRFNYNTKGKMAELALRYKWIFLIKLYALIK